MGHPVCEVIVNEGGEIVLYSKDKSRVLGRYPYGEGKKYKNAGTARAAAEEREREVQFFKHQSSAAVPDIVASVRQAVDRAVGEALENWRPVAGSISSSDLDQLTDTSDKELVPNSPAVTTDEGSFPPEEEEKSQPKPKEETESLVCVCPQCSTRLERESTETPCSQLKCPKCGAAMQAEKQEEQTEETFRLSAPVREDMEVLTPDGIGWLRVLGQQESTVYFPDKRALKSYPNHALYIRGVREAREVVHTPRPLRAHVHRCHGCGKELETPDDRAGGKNRPPPGWAWYLERGVFQHKYCDECIAAGKAKGRRLTPYKYYTMPYGRYKEAQRRLRAANTWHVHATRPSGEFVVWAESNGYPVTDSRKKFGPGQEREALQYVERLQSQGYMQALSDSTPQDYEVLRDEVEMWAWAEAHPRLRSSRRIREADFAIMAEPVMSGQYGTKQIDRASTIEDARALQVEYQEFYGTEWRVWIEQNGILVEAWHPHLARRTPQARAGRRVLIASPNDWGWLKARVTGQLMDGPRSYVVVKTSQGAVKAIKPHPRNIRLDTSLLKRASRRRPLVEYTYNLPAGWRHGSRTNTFERPAYTTNPGGRIALVDENPDVWKAWLIRGPGDEQLLGGFATPNEAFARVENEIAKAMEGARLVGGQWVLDPPSDQAVNGFSVGQVVSYHDGLRSHKATIMAITYQASGEPVFTVEYDGGKTAQAGLNQLLRGGRRPNSFEGGDMGRTRSFRAGMQSQLVKRVGRYAIVREEGRLKAVRRMQVRSLRAALAFYQTSPDEWMATSNSHRYYVYLAAQPYGTWGAEVLDVADNVLDQSSGWGSRFEAMEWARSKEMGVLAARRRIWEQEGEEAHWECWFCKRVFPESKILWGLHPSDPHSWMPVCGNCALYKEWLQLEDTKKRVLIPKAKHPPYAMKPGWHQMEPYLEARRFREQAVGPPWNQWKLGLALNNVMQLKDGRQVSITLDGRGHWTFRSLPEGPYETGQVIYQTNDWADACTWLNNWQAEVVRPLVYASRRRFHAAPSRLRKTLFLSEMGPSGRPDYKYQAPYIFYDRVYGKWRQDLRYFNDPEQARLDAISKGYVIESQRRFHAAPVSLGDWPGFHQKPVRDQERFEEWLRREKGLDPGHMTMFGVKEPSEWAALFQEYKQWSRSYPDQQWNTLAAHRFHYYPRLAEGAGNDVCRYCGRIIPDGKTLWTSTLADPTISSATCWSCALKSQWTRMYDETGRVIFDHSDYEEQPSQSQIEPYRFYWDVW